MSDAIQKLINAATDLFDADRAEAWRYPTVWEPVVDRLLQACQALQSGEPVVFTCHGNNAPAYGCNKPGDMSGTYYKAPQPVVPELTGKQWSAMRTVIREYAEKFRSADTYEMASAYMDAAPEAVYQALLSAGKGDDSHAPEMKTYRCVTCNVSGTDDGLCDAHKYDEQLSKHKSAGKGGE
jgi:hypothetical protein